MSSRMTEHLGPTKEDAYNAAARGHRDSRSCGGEWGVFFVAHYHRDGGKTLLGNNKKELEWVPSAFP